jgi:hypothetical protein
LFLCKSCSLVMLSLVGSALRAVSHHHRSSFTTSARFLSGKVLH